MIDFRKLSYAIVIVALMGLAPTVPGSSQDSTSESKVIAQLQAQVQDIKDDLAAMRGEIQAARSLVDQANRALQGISNAASGAQSTANQALSTAQQAQQANEAINEKIDRAFTKK